MKEKKDLIRIVKTPDGKIHIDDVKGKAPGRGAYVCTNEACVEKVFKNKAFERAFGQKIESMTYELLKFELTNRSIQNEK